MSEQTTPTAETETGAAPETAEQPDVEKQAFLERLNKESAKRKDADTRAKKLEAELAELRAQIDERESQGLPELERLRKDMERAQKRAEEAEQRAAAADAKVQRTLRERLVTAAAKDFNDPADAVAFVDLDGIEDERDAERAVKDLAKRKPHLLKAEEPKLPGRVLENGQRPTGKPSDERQQRAEEEGNMILEGIQALQRNWQNAGSL